MSGGKRVIYTYQQNVIRGDKNSTSIGFFKGGGGGNKEKREKEGKVKKREDDYDIFHKDRAWDPKRR